MKFKLYFIRFIIEEPRDFIFILILFMTSEFKSNKQISTHIQLTSMIQEVLDLMVHEKIIDQEGRNQLLTNLQGSKTIEDFLGKILEIFGEDPVAKHELQLKMCANEKVRRKFIPHLHYWMIKVKVAQAFGAQLQELDQMQLIQDQVIANFTDVDKMIKQIYQGLLGQDISKSDLEEIKLSLLDTKYLFNELIEHKDQEQEKIMLQLQKEEQEKEKERERVKMIKQEQQNKVREQNKQKNALKAEIQTCRQYVNELEEDSKSIPKHLDDYRLRKLQICLGNKFMVARQEPTSVAQFEGYLKKLQANYNSDIKIVINSILTKEDLRRNSRILREMVCGIDCHDLFRMIDNGKQIINKLNDQKQGKKLRVILFIGLSKAGKTTILTRLMGYEMEKKKIDGIWTVQPVGEVKQEHMELKIGHLPKSTTRYPRLFRIKPEFLDDDQDQEYVTYGMDSAGFEDTAGNVVQIQNRITTFDALKKCADKLQIAMVISEKSYGQTGEGVEKLARISSSLFKNYQIAKDSISFLFNKFTPQLTETFHDNIVALQQRIKIQGNNNINPNEKQFFKHLKKQSKDPKTMLTVDPITVNQKQLLQKISGNKKCIESVTLHLINDIGDKPKKDIKKFCDRCKRELKRCYKEGDLEGTQYYVKMLEMVGKQKRLDSGADQEILKIKSNMKEQLEKQIAKFSGQLQHFQKTVIREQEDRVNKLSSLHKDYLKLEKNLNKFNEIQQTPELFKQLENLIEEILHAYLIKTDDWNNGNISSLQQLIDLTLMGLDFYQEFAPEKDKNKLKQKLIQKQKYLKNYLKQKFLSLSQQNVQKTYQISLGLRKCLKNDQQLPLIKEIKEQYNELKNSITAIDYIARFPAKDHSFEQNKNVEKISKLLDFIDIVSTYPKDLISSINDDMKNTRSLIVIQIPKHIQNQFKSKTSFEEDEELEAENSVPPNENKDQIQQITQCLKTLEVLSKIPQINEYHDGRLTQSSTVIEDFILKYMKKFNRYKEAFNQNNSSEVRKDIKKLNKQFEQLRKMVTITEKQELKDRFQELQEDFFYSIITFIRTNDITQNLKLGQEDVLRTYLAKYQKLTQFKQIYKIIDNKNLKEDIQKMLDKIQAAIKYPLDSLFNDIKFKKITTKKLDLYLKYIEIIQSEGRFALGTQKTTNIYGLDQNIKNLIEAAKIQSPLMDLIKILTENKKLQENNIDAIQNYVNLKDLSQCRKAYQFMYEIKDQFRIKQTFFNNIDDNFRMIEDAFEQIRYEITEKIEIKTISVHSLQKLANITKKLKNIEQNDKNLFEQTFTDIRNKIKSLGLTVINRINSLLNSNLQSPSDFDEQTFFSAYKVVLDDKTQNYIDQKQPIEAYFVKYRKKVQVKIDSISMLDFDDDKDQKDLIENIKVLTKYFQNVSAISEKLSDPTHFKKSISKLKDQQKRSNEFSEKIIQFFEKSKGQAVYLKKQQFQKKYKKIKTLEKEVQSLKNSGFKMNRLQKFKQENKIKYLSENIAQIKDQKKQFLLNLTNKQKYMQELNKTDTNIQELYGSCQKQNKEAIKLFLQKQCQEKIKKIKSSYNSNYNQFKNNKSDLQLIISKLPFEIANSIQKSKNKVMEELEKEVEHQLEEISKQKDCQMSLIIALGKKAKLSNNEKIISGLVDQIKIRSRNINKIPKENSLQQIQQSIWAKKSQLKDLPGQLIPEIIKIEHQMIEKLSKHQKNLWNKIFQLHKQKQPISDDNFSDVGSIKGKKASESIGALVELYSSILSAVDQDKPLEQSNKLQCQKIQEELLSQFKKYQKEGDDMIQSFKNIEGDPINNQGIIDQTFYQISLYQTNFEIIAACKNQIVKTKVKSGFRNSVGDIKKTKNKLVEKVKMILGNKFQFFNDSIRNNSDDQEQARIQGYEKNLKILSVLQNSYNVYIKQPQIILQAIKKQIVDQTQKVYERRQKLIEQFFQSQRENLSPQINFVKKMFETIASKPRTFLVHFKDYQQKLGVKAEKKLNQKNENFIKLLKELLEKDQKQKKQLKKIKIKEDAQCDKEKNDIQKQSKTEIQRLKKSYQTKINTETDEQKKNGIIEQQKNRIREEEIQANKKITQLNTISTQKLLKVVKKHKDQSKAATEIVLQGIISFKKISSIAEINSKSNEELDRHLKTISKKKQLFTDIYIKLGDSDDPIANLIIEEHKSFEKLKGATFSKQTEQTNNSEYVLGEMLQKGTITQDQKEILFYFYNKFDKQQKRYHDTYVQLQDGSIVNKLVIQITTEGEQFKLDFQKQNDISNERRILLLAKIFALWSIISSESDNNENEEKIIYYKAHAAQIICILVTLCLDEILVSQVVSANRLAEVKTGQGKSIVLAVLSIYFALFGYEVHCACYSQMLSQRDQSQFNSLFEKCKVKNLIHYGIFETIIKKVLNQKEDNGDKQQNFESVIKQMITEEVPSNNGIINWLSKHISFINKFRRFFDKGSNKKIKKVLIIDEIDVLFNKDYFGDTFNQSIQLKDITIISLFQFIWKNRTDISFDKIKKSSEFKNVCSKFKLLQKVLENQIHGMVASLETYRNQNYILQDHQIMYKVQDTYKNVSYGYNTVYAYLYEYEKVTISKTAYDDHLTIVLCVAQFSYACLPEYYDSVLGVTGTLTCMPEYIKNYLSTNYKIQPKQMFPIPSVYKNNSKNRQIFDPICTPTADYFPELIKNISEQFKQNRPILVFFRTKTDLFNFYSSEEFKSYQKHTACITEEHTYFQRDQRIKRSSLKDTITLLTSSYIRGTDFKLLNKKALQAGGFHGIVAYLIDGTADYIQATGRVGRQGKHGTFIQIFQKQELEILEINQNSPASKEQIESKRKIKAEKEKDSCQSKLDQAKQRHDKTIQIFKDEKFDQDKLIKYIHNKNLFPEITKTKMRMVLMVDATCSMTTLFTRLRQFLPEIFDDVYETLREKKVQGCLEIQVILYRNYNSPVEELLQFSTFQSQCGNLKRFITSANVSGGWGNQAIQVGLQYVNGLKDINQIILIGDASGNTVQEVSQKRNRYKIHESQRINKGMIQTNTESQLIKLMEKKIKINGFYLKDKPEVRQYFQKVCKNGTAQFIDIHKKEASSTMTQFIVKRALTEIGGSKSANLIEQYKKILNRRMTK